MNLEMFKEIKTRKLFVQILAALVLGLLVLAALSKLCKVAITDDYATIFSISITAIWFILAAKFVRKNNISLKYFLDKPSPKFILEVPVTLIVTYVGSIGLILLMLFLAYCINPNVLHSLQSGISAEPPKVTNSFFIVLGFIGAVFVAPITEEFIFRGILMNRLYNKYGVIRSIIFSSLAFFIMHLNPNPMILFLGISCAILTYKYKSLIPSILLHCFNNLIVSLRDLGSKGTQTAFNDFTINSSLLIFGVILLILYVIYSFLKLRKISG